MSLVMPHHFLANDEYFMGMALSLATKATGWTNPNPLVGAVIVKDGTVIGRGYHHQVGAPHAEIEAFKNASVSPAGATLYVNLEPCVYHGRTPPCTPAIIEAGISRVVCATADPNPKMSGRGVAQLRAAGIDVTLGIGLTKAQILNEAFFAFQTKHRPFIVLKFAASLDGKLAAHTGNSQWITNEPARLYARRLRTKYQAILVGINTVLRDNPQLGTRSPGKKDPLRIILDSRLRIPLDAQVLRDRNVLIATTSSAPTDKMKLLQDRGVQILVFKSKTIVLNELLAALVKREVISILVEGGGKTLGNFVDNCLVDKVYAFYAPLLIGGKNAVSIKGQGFSKIQNAIRLKDTRLRLFGDNFLVSGYPESL